MMTTAVRGAVALTVSIFAIAFAGCVDDDPVVTGNRPDAGVPETGPTITTVVPAADLPDEDAPDCRRCAETLNTDSARGTLCRKNKTAEGISSTRTLNNLVNCVCYDKCIDVCGSYCSGSKNTNPCQLCVAGQCTQQYAACTQDTAQ